MAVPTLTPPTPARERREKLVAAVLRALRAAGPALAAAQPDARRRAVHAAMAEAVSAVYPAIADKLALDVAVAADALAANLSGACGAAALRALHEGAVPAGTDVRGYVEGAVHFRARTGEEAGVWINAEALTP